MCCLILHRMRRTHQKNNAPNKDTWTIERYIDQIPWYAYRNVDLRKNEKDAHTNVDLGEDAWGAQKELTILPTYVFPKQEAISRDLSEKMGANSSQEQPGAARTSQEQPGAARSSQEQRGFLGR